MNANTQIHTQWEEIQKNIFYNPKGITMITEPSNREIELALEYSKDIVLCMRLILRKNDERSLWISQREFTVEEVKEGETEMIACLRLDPKL